MLFPTLITTWNNGEKNTFNSIRLTWPCFELSHGNHRCSAISRDWVIFFRKLLSFKDAPCGISLFFWKLITEILVNGEINQCCWLGKATIQERRVWGRATPALLSLHCVFSDNVCNEQQIFPSLLIKFYCFLLMLQLTTILAEWNSVTGGPSSLWEISLYESFSSAL